MQHLTFQPFHHFTYITSRSPTLLLLHLHYMHFTYVTWPDPLEPNSRYATIMQQDNISTKHPMPLVLNGTSHTGEPHMGQTPLEPNSKYATIMQQDNISTKHPMSLVLNGTSQFLQCFAVTLSIHHVNSGQEVIKENAPSLPEQRAHQFLR